jgi:hypothetical protein
MKNISSFWTVASSLCLVFTGVLASSVHAQQDNASCQAIRRACRQAGFETGQGLVRDCFRPIIEGNSGNGKALPHVDRRIVEQCRSNNSIPTEPSGPGDKENGNAQLAPADGGEVVYDSSNHVYWLADADFAASPQGLEIQRTMGVTGINPNGGMDFATARKWVAALNAYNHNQGYLAHNNWQLPATPLKDSSCGALGPGGASFGALCQSDALGNLYYVGLKNQFPTNAAAFAGASIEPFRNVQPAYYWTQTSGGVNGTGKQVFSFNSGHADVTEINDSYYYVLPMVPKQSGPIGGTAPSCHAASRLALYTQGPAANQAVYDCDTGISWLADANLATTTDLGLSGELPGGVRFNRPYPTPHPITLNIPRILGGAMMWNTAGEWIALLNDYDRHKGYLGNQNWQLPDSPADLKTLFGHMQLSSGDSRLMAQGDTGPFHHLQPFFYWELCVPDPNEAGKGVSECSAGVAPSGKLGREMSFDFTFGYGLLSTDLSVLNYFVMVYYPAAGASPQPTPPDPRQRR